MRSLNLNPHSVSLGLKIPAGFPLQNHPSMKKLLPLMSIAGALSVLAPSQAPAAEKNDWTLSFPETKAHFVKVNLEWAKKEEYWKPTKEELEAKFDQLDADKDGKLTQEEYDAGNGKKAKKAKKKKAN